MPHFVRPMQNDVKMDQSAMKVKVALDSVGQDGFVEQRGDGIEVRQPATVMRPTAPAKAQLEEHLPLHLNYRSWCRHCVFGKAHAMHH